MNLDVCSEENIIKDFRSITVLPNPSLKKIASSRTVAFKNINLVYQTF